MPGLLRSGPGGCLRPGSSWQGEHWRGSRTSEKVDSRMTPEELEQIAEDERAEQGKYTQRVNVCVAAGCLSCQSQSVKDALEQEVIRRGAKDHCQVKGVGCMGLCSEGPLVSTSNGVLYKKVEGADSPAVLDSLAGEPVSRLVCPTEVPFFQ